MVEDALKQGVVGQAVTRGEVIVNTINPRDFATDGHKTVDDRPFGGGDGMVMLVDPLVASLESIRAKGQSVGHRVYLSAQGRLWRDDLARDWASRHQVITLICGRYGGVDQRFLNAHVDEEISVGDYILSGGELAALVVVDSLARMQPGVLGNVQSKDQESFSDGLLEAPLFTRPQELSGARVPASLLSGNHAKISEFRRAISLTVTLEKRPDLLTKAHEIELGKAMRLLGSLPVEELKACGLGEQLIRNISQSAYTLR